MGQQASLADWMPVDPSERELGGWPIGSEVPDKRIRLDRRELLRNAHQSDGCGDPIFRHKLRRGPRHPLIGRHMVFSGYMGGVEQS
jgi:hypothetical protein